MSFFGEMIERDRIVPILLTYNILIDEFYKRGMVEKARTVLCFIKG